MTAPDAVTRGRLPLSTGGLTLLHWVGVALAGATGVVHLALGAGALPDPLGVAALLAAGGFAGGIALVLADYRRRVVLALWIPFTAAQMLLWYLLNEPSGPGDVTALAAFDKVVQSTLVVVLVVLLWRGRATGSTRASDAAGPEE